MLTKKIYKSERTFSIMLAEEILRAKLEKHYGRRINFFQCDIVSSPIKEVKHTGEEITNKEIEALRYHPTRERRVEINAIIGPFERLYPGNPPEDKRCRARRAEAILRLFDVGTGSVQWELHYLFLNIFNDGGTIVNCFRCFFQDGIFQHKQQSKNNENHCQAMCDSQIDANYPGTNPELHRSHSHWVIN